jgi:hypothetical protein
MTAPERYASADIGSLSSTPEGRTTVRPSGVLTYLGYVCAGNS